jgi:hypothetical protein
VTAVPHVVVVIPARDEYELIGATLRSIRRAIGHARRRRVIGRVVVEVVAHKCLDATARRARSVLWRPRGARVVEDDQASTIGAVRDDAARRGLSRLPVQPEQSWVLSTDADTIVARDWITGIIGSAGQFDVAAVVGLATIDRWNGTPEGGSAYDRVLAGKMHHDSVIHQHDHVYGANLAVRADAYLDCGGFPHVAHGEDQRLVDLLESRGHRLLRSRDSEVVTSGRFLGRAERGLAAYLRELDREVAAGDPAAVRAAGS